MMSVSAGGGKPEPLTQLDKAQEEASHPNRMLDIDFRDLTGMRQTLTGSLAKLPPELRWKIAEQLLQLRGDFTASL